MRRRRRRKRRGRGGGGGGGGGGEEGHLNVSSGDFVQDEAQVELIADQVFQHEAEEDDNIPAPQHIVDGLEEHSIALDMQEETCAICMESLTADVTCHVLQCCNQVLHHSCIREWLQTVSGYNIFKYL